jgi:hypothetical protein
VPLTDDEKVLLRMYLGYTDVDRGAYSRVEGSMNAVSEGGIVQLRRIMAKILDIDDTFLVAASKHQKVTRVEQVHLAGADEIINLRHQGRRYVSNLATILGLRVAVNYFDETGGTANQANAGYVYRG